jgi:hypothetical protein
MLVQLQNLKTFNLLYAQQMAGGWVGQLADWVSSDADADFTGRRL